jgi:riboflavin kinase / FMN adenylyltransferase
MNTFEGIDGLRNVPHGAVMAIGNFDGIHRGHAQILETMKSLRTCDATPTERRLAVVTFEPHPLTVLKPQFAPPRLTPPLLKRALLEAAGVDDYVVLPPTRQILGLDAQEFWRILRDDVQPAHLVEGPTFNFGKNRGGTIQRLREWSAGTAVQLHIVEPVMVPLLDLTIVPVSSSLIRWLLANGRVRDVAICLGRPYVIEGVVVKGYQRGRTIGVPTINLDCEDQQIPMDGVYAGRCVIDQIDYPAAVSIGSAPTFEGAKWQIEAHLIGFEGDLYGRVVRLEMIDWIRDQRRFGRIEELKDQIARDIDMTRVLSLIDPAIPVASLEFA